MTLTAGTATRATLPRPVRRTGNRPLRFSGHETFACRFAWLPKAYRLLAADPLALNDDQHAMVELGIGKNMVRALRFWIDATGVATPHGAEGFELTQFAHAIFGLSGFDPYLEDRRTLWLIHWILTSRTDGPLFAWQYLFNQWPYPDFTRSEVLTAFQRETLRRGYVHSPVTLTQHLDVFLHTYLRSRTSVAVEDSLDSPLVELNLLQIVGERRGDGGRREPVFAFRRDTKADVTTEVFSFCLLDYWDRQHATDATLTLRTISSGVGSPGAVLKLTDDDVRTRLELYAQLGMNRHLSYQASAVQGLLTRHSRPTVESALKAVYREGRRHG